MATPILSSDSDSLCADLTLLISSCRRSYHFSLCLQSLPSRGWILTQSVSASSTERSAHTKPAPCPLHRRLSCRLLRSCSLRTAHYVLLTADLFATYCLLLLHLTTD